MPVITAAVVVALGACTSASRGGTPPAPAGPARPSTTQTTPATTSTRPTVPVTTTTTTTIPPVTALAVTPINWSSCGSDEQCGSLRVPLDYQHPHGRTIAVAVERHLAEYPSQRIGSLVIDPGGPGGSGIDDMTNELDSLTPALLEEFDIVLFDPRGVQRSAPFTCGESTGGTSSAPSGPGPDPVPSSALDASQLIAGLRQYALGCEKTSGSILPYLGTDNVARDLERLRIALGDSKLTYMGQSYGSLIGELYVEMFPTHVRAMVLDSTIDPALDANQMALDQAKSFEKVLDDFFSWCASSASCGWRPSGTPAAALVDLIRAAYTHPSHGDGGPNYAGAGDMYDAILSGLYSIADWSRLGSELAADAAGDGAPIISMATSYTTSGSTNSGDAYVDINCLDHPVSRDLGSYGHLATVDASQAPVFGPLFAWGETECAVWPKAEVRTPRPVSAPGSPPIVVVGTTGDPATPYTWAESVAQDLAHGVLVTFEGDDHVAYFYSQCVKSAVQAYLVDRVAPRNGTVCTS